MAEKVQGCTELVKMLLGVACKHLHSTYAGLQKSIQQQWAFVQQVTPEVGDAFVLVEQALREAFFSDLFQGFGEGIPGRGVTRLPVKHLGLDLPDPKKMVRENWTVSCAIIGHIVQ